jgi:hypothetical protein
MGRLIGSISNYLFAHLAWVAFRAISLRFLADNFSAWALPPFTKEET